MIVHYQQFRFPFILENCVLEKKLPAFSSQSKELTSEQLRSAFPRFSAGSQSIDAHEDLLLATPPKSSEASSEKIVDDNGFWIALSEKGSRLLAGNAATDPHAIDSQNTKGLVLHCTALKSAYEFATYRL